jgi:hypothetical protein
MRADSIRPPSDMFPFLALCRRPLIPRNLLKVALAEVAKGWGSALNRHADVRCGFSECMKFCLRCSHCGAVQSPKRIACSTGLIGGGKAGVENLSALPQTPDTLLAAIEYPLIS